MRTSTQTAARCIECNALITSDDAAIEMIPDAGLCSSCADSWLFNVREPPQRHAAAGSLESQFFWFDDLAIDSAY